MNGKRSTKKIQIPETLHRIGLLPKLWDAEKRAIELARKCARLDADRDHQKEYRLKRKRLRAKCGS